jgi:hypothetical protein
MNSYYNYDDFYKTEVKLIKTAYTELRTKYIDNLDNLTKKNHVGFWLNLLTRVYYRIIDITKSQYIHKYSSDDLATFRTALQNCNIFFGEPQSETELLYRLDLWDDNVLTRLGKKKTSSRKRGVTKKPSKRKPGFSRNKK